ncbi:hypothetical protein RHOER0001_3008 [Rhodococcus erythropolis SK121]|nr:hypothetical protein RHOER0001_3008 [Rhodococcus erythropolis SK121]
MHDGAGRRLRVLAHRQSTGFRSRGVPRAERKRKGAPGQSFDLPAALETCPVGDRPDCRQSHPKRLRTDR